MRYLRYLAPFLLGLALLTACEISEPAATPRPAPTQPTTAPTVSIDQPTPIAPAPVVAPTEGPYVAPYPIP